MGAGEVVTAQRMLLYADEDQAFAALRVLAPGGPGVAFVPRADGVHLLQFAILGSLFVQHVWNIEKPRVGLVNIGEEEGKGNILAQAAYPLLKECPQINFIGNIEGRDVFMDKADVMVCEGFTGNVLLKMAESIHDIMLRRNIRDEYFDRFDFEQYGGVPVLGVAKPVIIGHGISHGPSFSNMIDLAVRMIEKDLLGKIKESFQKTN